MALYPDAVHCVFFATEENPVIRWRDPARFVKLVSCSEDRSLSYDKALIDACSESDAQTKHYELPSSP